MTANVKRAVAATLDRPRAAARVATAHDNLDAAAEFERVAVAALSSSETSEYQGAVTNAYQDEQVARLLD